MSKIEFPYSVAILACSRIRPFDCEIAHIFSLCACAGLKNIMVIIEKVPGPRGEDLGAEGLELTKRF